MLQAMAVHHSHSHVHAHVHVHSDSDSDDEEDDDDDDDDGDFCTCAHCVLSRFGFDEDSDAEDDSDDDINKDHPNQPHHHPNQHHVTCAICLEPPTSQRSFVRLPCCDTHNTSSSSLQFCQRCFVKCMAKNGIGIPAAVAQGLSFPSTPNNTTGNDDASDNQDQDDEDDADPSSIFQMIGECPRCRRLVVLKEDTTNTNTNTNTNTHHATQPPTNKVATHEATHRDMHWYTARKGGGDYRPHLLTIAWSNPDYIPAELLLNDSTSEDKMALLCQWGILQKKDTATIATTNTVTSTIRTKWSQISQQLMNRVVRPGWNYLIQKPLEQWLEIDFPDFRSALATTKDDAQTVYCMPTLQTQLDLRWLLLSHLEVFDSSESVDRRQFHHHHHYSHDPHSRPPDGCLLLREAPMGLMDRVANNRRQCALVASNCFASGWIAVSSLRLVRAVRLWNRGVTLVLLSSTKLLLPPVVAWPRHQQSHWYAATLLNVALVYVALQIVRQLVGMAILVGEGYCLVQLVGSCLAPPESPGRRKIRNVSLAVLGLYWMYQGWGAMRGLLVYVPSFKIPLGPTVADMVWDVVVGSVDEAAIDVNVDTDGLTTAAEL